ncbi:hypothetical protein K443DRAFT_221303 [Laccaria amethystina LaAM-08-1]|uniref:Uncharacterized protein n=1 Tax=Laccaria amethystina LaAM-08-1 TaxID=1095629 RepID=A0A0C9XKF9_9AGAR|nr:hypothetical protein K443DRAFT_221303 [Laccaria amethystina LaAM-08-1]
MRYIQGHKTPRLNASDSSGPMTFSPSPPILSTQLRVEPHLQRVHAHPPVPWYPSSHFPSDSDSSSTGYVSHVCSMPFLAVRRANLDSWIDFWIPRTCSFNGFGGGWTLERTTSISPPYFLPAPNATIRNSNTAYSTLSFPPIQQAPTHLIPGPPERPARNGG